MITRDKDEGRAAALETKARLVYYLAVGENMFFDCPQCGGLHNMTLPGNVDCRDDSERFTPDEVDTVFGAWGWETVGYDD